MKFKYLFIDEVQSSEKAKKEIKEIVDFYKLNNPNNYDYSDKDLLNMRVLLDYITFLEGKVIEQQTSLHDIDKTSCDRLKALNEIKKVVKSGYYEMHLNPERFSMKILDILKKEGVE